MFNFTELVKNNTTSAERTSDKKNALKENKIYIQIAPRVQRGKNYINAIATTSAMYDKKTNKYKSLNLNKRVALALALAYASSDTLNGATDIVVSCDTTMLNGARDYVKSNGAKSNKDIDTLVALLRELVKAKENALK